MCELPLLSLFIVHQLSTITMLGSSSRKRKSNAAMNLQYDVIKALAVEASENHINWDDVAPVYFSEWLEIFARSHGVVKDIMFLAMIPRISGLLGARTCLKLSEGHRESLGSFTLCLAPPDAAKSPANNHGGKIPMSFVEHENNVRLTIDKFTEVGLRQHLIDNNGTAIIVKDEMYPTLKQILNEKEMGTLCRLYDGDSLFVTTGSNSSTTGVEKTTIALGGFVQVMFILRLPMNACVPENYITVNRCQHYLCIELCSIGHGNVITLKTSSTYLHSK